MLRCFILAALLAMAPFASAQTAAEDEARLEELIRREQAVRQVAAGRDGSAETNTAAGAAASAVEVAAQAPEALAPAPAAPAPATAPPPAASPATANPTFDPLAEADPNAPIADEDALAGEDWRPHDPKEIAVGDLAAHVGKAVRVRSLGGRTRVGRIESVGDTGVTLVSPMGGGYAKYTLPYSQITRIERL